MPLPPSAPSHSTLFRDDVLIGKVAVVTGGGTGIGAEITRELARQGATVVIASRKLDKIHAAAAGLSAQLGREVIGLRCDIRDRDQVDAFVEEVVQRAGRIDILVNNGGGQFFSAAEFIRPRGWDAVIQTNLTGTWNLTRAVADRWMLRHGGSIINITMTTARGFPGMAHSCAARSGIEGLTRTLAVEWAGSGIRLNCVQPGLILSNGLHNYPSGESLAYERQRQIPLKRLGTCPEVAHVVALLAGPGGGYITGQTLGVDGGTRLWGETWPIPDPEPLPPVVVPREPWEE